MSEPSRERVKVNSQVIIECIVINHHHSINDIVNSDQYVPIGVFILFADDTNIFVEDENDIDITERVAEYMKLNQLHINMGK